MALEEASVDVVLDFSNFEPEIRRQLNRVIVLAARRGRAAGTAFGRAFATAARPHIQSVFARIRLNERAAALGRQAGSDFATALQRSANDADIDLTRLGTRAGAQLRESIDREASRGTLSRTLAALGGALSALGGSLRVAGLLSGLALLTGAAAQATVGILKLGLSISQTLGPALSTLAGLASTAGTQLLIFGSAAIVGAALVLTTLKVALSGVSEALKAAASGDADKLAKALEDLAPAARKFVRAIGSAKFGLDEFRIAVQQATFLPLERSAQQIVAVLPKVSEMLSAIGSELGSLGAEFIRVATSGSTMGRISSVAANVANALSRLRPAIEPLIGAFTRLAQFGSSAFGPLADLIVRAAKAFETWVTAGIESGRFMEQLTNSLATLRDVFRALVAFGQDVATIFRAIGAAASAAGIESANLFSAIGLLTSIVADFVSSAEGMQILTSVFGSLNQIVQALQPALLVVLRGLEPLASIIAELATGLGPGLTAGLNGLLEGLRALIPAARPVGEAIGGFLEIIGVGLGAALKALSPFLTAISIGLGAMLKAALPIMRAFADVVGQVAESVAAFFGSDEVQALIARTSALFARFGETVGAAISQVAPLLAQLVDTFLTGLIPVWDELNRTIIDSGLFDALGQLALAFGTLLSEALVKLAPLVTQVLGSLGQIVSTTVVPALSTFLDVITQVVNQIAAWLSDPATSTALTAFVQALGQAFTELFATIGPLLPQLAVLAVELGVQLGQALIQILPLLPSLIRSVVGLFTAIIPLLPELIKLATLILQVALQSGALQRILTLVIVALRLFSSVLTTSVGIVTTFINIVTGIVNVFKKILGAINPVLDALRSFLSLAARASSLSLAGLVLPKFDRGGIIGGTSPIAAVLHPNEVVIPLSDPRRAAQLAMQSGLVDLLGQALGGAGMSSAAGGVLIGPGAVQLNIQGDVSPARAQRIGERAGYGLATVLSRQMISNAIRKQ